QKSPSVPGMSTEPVKVLCFDTLLQVLIPKELESNIVRAHNLRTCPVSHTGTVRGGGALLLELRSRFWKGKSGRGQGTDLYEAYDSQRVTISQGENRHRSLYALHLR